MVAFSIGKSPPMDELMIRSFVEALTMHSDISHSKISVRGKVWGGAILNRDPEFLGKKLTITYFTTTGIMQIQGSPRLEDRAEMVIYNLFMDYQKYLREGHLIRMMPGAEIACGYLSMRAPPYIDRYIEGQRLYALPGVPTTWHEDPATPPQQPPQPPPPRGGTPPAPPAHDPAGGARDVGPLATAAPAMPTRKAPEKETTSRSSTGTSRSSAGTSRSGSGSGGSGDHINPAHAEHVAQVKKFWTEHVSAAIIQSTWRGHEVRTKKSGTRGKDAIDDAKSEFEWDFADEKVGSAKADPVQRGDSI